MNLSNKVKDAQLKLGRLHEVVEVLVNDLEDFSRSDQLLPIGFKERIPSIPRHILMSTSFFHCVCANEYITLEVVQCILDLLPEAVHIWSDLFCAYPDNILGDNEHFVPIDKSRALPLHIACFNPRCPSSVIKLLVARNPCALRVLSILGEPENYCGFDSFIEGLTPFHYYLTRKSNIDLSVVKMLAKAYPEALTAVDAETKMTPLHMLMFNPNIDNFFDTLSYLSSEHTHLLHSFDGHRRSALSLACLHPNIKFETIKFIHGMAPEACRHYLPVPDRFVGRGSVYLPLHNLCMNRKLNRPTKMKALAFLVDEYPQALLQGPDRVPILLAVSCEQSWEFCKYIIDKMKMIDDLGDLGGDIIQEACRGGTLEVVINLLDMFPEEINRILVSHRWLPRRGRTPLHAAITSYRLDSSKQADIIKVILKRAPESARTALGGTLELHHGNWGLFSPTTLPSERDFLHLPLHQVCAYSWNVEDVKAIYDAYPEAILVRLSSGHLPIDLASALIDGSQSFMRPLQSNSESITFLNAQYQYALQAQDRDALATPNNTGRLPLHRALQDAASLGSIKLLVSAHPASIQVADNSEKLPVHIACEHESADVVQFLVERYDDDYAWNVADLNGDYPLHCACRGGNYDVVSYLIGTLAAASVSIQNQMNTLPIHLLCEHASDSDRESPEYIEAFMILLRANPGIVGNGF